MDFIQAQFSLKFEIQAKIRRFANDIEDFLQDHYSAPQTMPIPDEIAPEAPRIILYSKNGHSKIIFTQISVDFIVRFDGDYTTDFEKTKGYVRERISMLVSLLQIIGIKSYLFCGISYNIRLNIGDKSPADYIKDYLGGNIAQTESLYEASQSIAIVKENKFFINQKIGTFKEFSGRPGVPPNLVEFTQGNLVSEGVTLALDINNRYQYVFGNQSISMNNCAQDIDELLALLAENIKKWE